MSHHGYFRRLPADAGRCRPAVPSLFMSIRSLVPASLAVALTLSACGGSSQHDAVRAYINQVDPIVTGFQTQAEKLAESGVSDTDAMKAAAQTLQQTIDSLSAVQPSDPAIAAAHAHLVQAPKYMKEAVDLLLAAVQDPTTATPDLEQQVNALLTKAQEETNTYFTTMKPLLPEDMRAEWEKDMQAGDQ